MRARWPTTTLAEVCDLRGGGTPSKVVAKYWQGEIPWVSPKDVKSDVVSDSIDHITPEAISESATSLIPSESILVVVRSGILARIVPIAITGRELAINQDLKALCPKRVINVRFVYYLLQAKMDLLLSMVTRGATVHRLTTDLIRSLEFLLPPLDEQRRIVGILDEAFASIAAAKANYEANLRNARALFESHLQSVFSQRGAGWVEKTVAELVKDGALVKPFDGNHGEIHPTKGDYTTSGVPFIMACDLQGGKVDTKGCKFIPRSLADSLRVGFAKDGDVLISHKGTIGRSAILSIDDDYVMLTPQVTSYRVGDNAQLLNRFVRYYFMSPIFQGEIVAAAKDGSTRAYIGITKQLGLRFRYPGINRQREITAKLDALTPETQRLESIYRQKLDALDALKKSLLHDAFRGAL